MTTSINFPQRLIQNLEQRNPVDIYFDPSGFKTNALDNRIRGLVVQHNLTTNVPLIADHSKPQGVLERFYAHLKISYDQKKVYNPLFWISATFLSAMAVVALMASCYLPQMYRDFIAERTAYYGALSKKYSIYTYVGGCLRDIRPAEIGDLMPNYGLWAIVGIVIYASSFFALLKASSRFFYSANIHKLSLSFFGQEMTDIQTIANDQDREGNFIDVISYDEISEKEINTPKYIHLGPYVTHLSNCIRGFAQRGGGFSHHLIENRTMTNEERNHVISYICKVFKVTSEGLLSCWANYHATEEEIQILIERNRTEYRALSEKQFSFFIQDDLSRALQFLDKGIKDTINLSHASQNLQNIQEKIKENAQIASKILRILSLKERIKNLENDQQVSEADLLSSMGSRLYGEDFHLSPLELEDSSLSDLPDWKEFPLFRDRNISFLEKILINCFVKAFLSNYKKINFPTLHIWEEFQFITLVNEWKIEYRACSPCMYFAFLLQVHKNCLEASDAEAKKIVLDYIEIVSDIFTNECEGVAEKIETNIYNHYIQMLPEFHQALKSFEADKRYKKLLKLIPEARIPE